MKPQVGEFLESEYAKANPKDAFYEAGHATAAKHEEW